MEGEILQENVNWKWPQSATSGVVVVVEWEVGRTVGERHKSCCSLFG